MQELGLSAVFDEIDAAFKAKDFNRVENLLWPALNQFSDVPQLWFYAGNVLFQTDRVALAAQAFEKCAALDRSGLVLANLGAAYRRMNLHDKGINVLKAAIDQNPDYAPALVNLGAMYVNEGLAETGIPYLEKAVEIGKRAGHLETGALWNLGLLYLESGRFAEGFNIYRRGIGQERAMRFYGGEKFGTKDPALLQDGDEHKGKTIIVWGEQGIGDELMFGRLIEEARKDFAEVIFECHPRLETLHRRAHPGMRIYPTRKDEAIRWPMDEKVTADYKAPLGDLAALYRPTLESFLAQTDITYSVDEAEVKQYRGALEDIAKGRKIVGIATRGGVMQTARQYRTIRHTELDYLFERTDCLFVSLDYDDMSGTAEYLHTKYGADRFRWFPAITQHWDYHHSGELVKACDLTVTVCQSIAHMCGALGVNSRILVPFRHAWRYAAVGDPETWYWYPNERVKTLRQLKPDEGWAPTMDRVIADIKGLQ